MAKKSDFMKKIQSGELQVPVIKGGMKIKWKIEKKVDNWVLVSCNDGAFLWFIYQKELKELEKIGHKLEMGKEIEAEIIDTRVRSEEGYFILSITKLMQYDIWKNFSDKARSDEVLTVIPTEANLWGLLMDVYWIKWFIPLSQLAPINYPRVEDGDQERIFDHLLKLIWKEFKVRVINIDEIWKRMILSEKEALREEREEILKNLEIGSEFDGVISWVSSYWMFVTIGGWIEGLVHISEITYWHVNDIKKFWKIWDATKVKVIWNESGKISFSIKQMKPDPWSVIPAKHKLGDIIEWEVVRFVPYWVFIRVHDDINWLVHLSELTERSSAAWMVKVWQKVRAKIILLEPQNRKIGLTMKDIEQPFDTSKRDTEGAHPFLRWNRADRPQRSDKPRTDRPRQPREDNNWEKPKLVIKTKSQLNNEASWKSESKIQDSKDTNKENEKTLKVSKKTEVSEEKTAKTPKTETSEKSVKTTKKVEKADDKEEVKTKKTPKTETSEEKVEKKATKKTAEKTAKEDK